MKPGGSKSVVAVPSPATPKAKGGPPAASDDDLDAEVAEDEQEGDDDPLDVVSQSSAVALQAQMLRNAAALLRKRTKPSSKSEPSSQHQ